MRRIKASHPDYLEISQHMALLNVLKNRHVHNRLKSSIHYTPGMLEPENEVTIHKIENVIDEWLDGGAFIDWINQDNG